VPPAHGRFLQKQLAGARLNLLPGAGHLPFLTQAAAFNGILAECLSTIN
jgi:pimeloyl-ACP methyl ester carboxylesterase